MQETEILKDCLETGKTAYSQETARQELIGTKADYLMKYLTLFVAILNLSIPLVLKYSTPTIVTPCFRRIYIALMALLIIGIGGTLLIQYPQKVNLFPSAGDALEYAKKHTNEMEDERARIYQQILRYTSALKSLETSNNRRVRLLTGVFWIYLLIVLLMGVFFGYIIFSLI